ncbi:hypothetical protein O9993_15875 [Vibrio lentus]|nr:hypothetical protein [Vibrio lentus]
MFTVAYALRQQDWAAKRSEGEITINEILLNPSRCPLAHTLLDHGENRAAGSSCPLKV